MTPNLTHLETELQQLKTSVIEMWNIVVNQIEKSKTALVSLDKDYCQGYQGNRKTCR